MGELSDHTGFFKRPLGLCVQKTLEREGGGRPVRRPLQEPGQALGEQTNDKSTVVMSHPERNKNPRVHSSLGNSLEIFMAPGHTPPWLRPWSLPFQHLSF